MKKILFVCLGNICRSPMAEFVMKNMVQSRGLSYVIESAATSRYEIGNDVYPPAQAKLREKGIPFTKREARQITKEDYASYDFIIGMDRENIENIHRIMGADPEGKIYKLMDFAGEDRPIADPYYTGNFEQTYQDIVKGLEGFFRKQGE